jgi:CubicO group peptidase (beta-lactamase class C family)/D-alanyl-D-alanine dipeptidase
MLVSCLASCLVQLVGLNFPISNTDAAEITAEASEAPPSIVFEGYHEVEQRLSEFIDRECRDKQIPAISFAVVDDDRIVIAEGHGAVDADGRKPATAHTVYRVGSISKLFTDLCVMRLVAQGKLELDEDVSKYLPNFGPQNPFDVPVTLRQLMSHQSGLVREPPVGHYFDDTSPTLAKTIASLNQTALIYKPGTRTKYSNAAVSVAGYVVERQMGESFETHVQRVLLAPLDMAASSFRSTAAIERNLAMGWMRSHHAPRFVAPNFALGTLPAGNLYASMPELCHLMIALLNDGQYAGRQVIEPKTIEAMLKPNKPSEEKSADYGIGFRLSTIDGHPTFGHGGAVYGYSTQFVALPNEKIGIAASASLDSAGGVLKRLTDYAIRLMLAAKAKQLLPSIDRTHEIDSEAAAKLVGDYAGGSKFLHITRQDNDVYLFDDAYLKRLRKTASGYAVDDLTGFGSQITQTSAGDVLLGDRAYKRVNIVQPLPPPERFQNLIGEYGWDHNPLYIFEDRGRLWALIEWFDYCPLTEISPRVFAFPEEGMYQGEQLLFANGGDHPAPYVTAASVRFNRRLNGLDVGKTFQIKPTKPVEELYRMARLAKPPVEPDHERDFDLVDLTSLDGSIKLDIRYATTNNFMGTPFYKQARAFMQRPAAEALVRVHQRLKKQGFGLEIYDAYRPWYVTKMFWDGTRPAEHEFVADPEKGSKHNRGCAVDLTLYDLKTGQQVAMVSGYDEMTQRSYPYYPGGSGQARWHRNLLRTAMEQEGFTVYPAEWWHFDYKDWEKYPIGTVSFEEVH